MALIYGLSLEQLVQVVLPEENISWKGMGYLPKIQRAKFFGCFHNKFSFVSGRKRKEEDVELMSISVKIRNEKEMRFPWK